MARPPDGWRVARMRMLPGALTGNASLLQQRAQAAPARDGRAVVEAFFARLEAFDIDSFAALFAQDGRHVMPFSPEGFPKRLEGHAAVFNQYKDMPQHDRAMRFPDLVIRELAESGQYFVI